MTKKKKTAASEKTEQPKVQRFKVKKKFPTDERVYEVGEYFEHSDKRVINFLKSKNII